MPPTDLVSSNLLDRSASSATNSEEHALSEAHTVEAKSIVGDRYYHVIYPSRWD